MNRLFAVHLPPMKHASLDASSPWIGPAARSVAKISVFRARLARFRRNCIAEFNRSASGQGGRAPARSDQPNDLPLRLTVALDVALRFLPARNARPAAARRAANRLPRQSSGPRW